jgi:hypothetical protein
MVVSLPPARTTVRRQARLRRVVRGAAFLALALAAALPSADAIAMTARTGKRIPTPAPFVLVSATVSDRARSSMPTASWSRFVATYAGASSAPLPDDATPDAESCREAAGDYLVVAAFDVRDDLPGMPNASDRLPGRAHVTIVACADGRILADRAMRIDGDPVPTAEAGTVDALDRAWSRAVPAGLATAGVLLGRIAHVRRLESGGGLFVVDAVLGTIPQAAILTDVAVANRSRRPTPLHLTVTQSRITSAEAIFAQSHEGDPAPAVGDTVEYVASVTSGGRYPATNGTTAPPSSTT